MDSTYETHERPRSPRRRLLIGTLLVGGLMGSPLHVWAQG